jgi:hypothetical protein
MKLAFSDTIDSINLKTIPMTTRMALIITGISVVALVLILTWSFFSKANKNTTFTIDAITERIFYKPRGVSSPTVEFRNVLLRKSCRAKDLESVVSARVSFTSSSKVSISKTRTNKFIMTVTDGYALVDEYGEKTEFPGCLMVIQDLDVNEHFSMKLDGRVEIGNEVADKNLNKMPRMTQSGTIIVTEKAFLTGVHYSLLNTTIRKGDYIFPSDEDTPDMSGFLEVFKDEKYIQAMIFYKGNNLEVKRYRSSPNKLGTGFIDKITSDQELAWLVTGLIVFIQAAFLFINISLRIKLLNTIQESTSDEK